MSERTERALSFIGLALVTCIITVAVIEDRDQEAVFDSPDTTTFVLSCADGSITIDEISMNGAKTR